MLDWSLDVLTASPHVGAVVVARPDGHLFDRAGVTVVAGGAQRSHSVRNALAAAPRDADLVLVHDAARPLLTGRIVDDCIAAMEDPAVDAAIAAAQLTDTVKQAESRDGRPVVRTTLDRSLLWAVQTPQVFRRSALERVLAQPDEVLARATDDASLIEAAGGRVVLVPSPRSNLKVTTPEDLQLAELLLTTADTPSPSC